MPIKAIVLEQHKKILDSAASHVKGVAIPREGWIVTARKALRMSASDLAARMNVTRASISSLERSELDGGVTLKRMERVADAMGCRFIYAIVPESDVDSMLTARAKRKARQLVEQADQQMSLEGQRLSPEQLDFEVERITKEILAELPRGFWSDKE
ncbi:MAG: mobile mystery protein A [Calditrichaeota bacterium]|nr:mobile mystery protein A [Calditrichota bacterium]